MGWARISRHTKLFSSLLSPQGAFSGMVDSLVQENISGGEPSVSELNIVQLCDQYTKHCPSTKEFEDQSLPLWRNLHIHRSGLVLDVYTQIQGVLKAYSPTKTTIFKEL